MTFLRDEPEGVPHDDDVGVVADIAGGSAQVDDALCLRALEAVGVDMAHDVVADEFFSGLRFLIVDVVLMGDEFVDLFFSDREAQLHLGFREGNPQKPPGFKLLVLGEDVLHFLRSVAGAEGGFVIIAHIGVPFSAVR